MNERICHAGKGQHPVTRTQASVAWALDPGLRRVDEMNFEEKRVN
jgi:hypothetical protein